MKFNGNDIYRIMFNGQTINKLMLNSNIIPIAQPLSDFGVTGDGVTDDTAAIQAALDVLDYVYFPDGTYMIDADESLFPRSNQTIVLSNNAVLKAMPNASDSYAVIRVWECDNVSISGGKIIGERNEHTEIDGEWGMGIQVHNNSTNISIRNMEIKDCWGDGIYVGDENDTRENNVLIDNVICDNNRRQGLSITYANGVTVRNSVFKNTNGTDPQCGIDVEPNSSDVVKNLKFLNVQCFGNVGDGLDLCGYSENIEDIEIIDCDFTNNAGVGLLIENVKDASITDTTILNNQEEGIYLYSDASNITFSNVDISNNYYDGVFIETSSTTIEIANITFENCTFANNGQDEADVYDGVYIDNYNDEGCIIRDIQFINCNFIDDQAAHTQRYGLSIGTYSGYVTNIIADHNCVFDGNISGNFEEQGILIYGPDPRTIPEYTNLFPDINSWTAQYGSKSIVDDEFIYTVSSLSGSARIEYESFAVVEEHIYYVRGEIYPKYDNGTYFRLNNDTSQRIIMYPTPNEWNIIDAPYTATTTGDIIAPFHHWTDDYYESGDIIKFRNLMCVDLTSVFGAGNEPTRMWCRSNLAYIAPLS